ncbi:MULTISPECIES: hypothetical protein [unclassified Bradyrhizobium]|uniref:hypothetical protein n=1 Tax=unclassified Bradyrhizobium TaxID=2631580 RepID=UPI0012EC0CCE|nr:MULTISPECIES: hypothetical protein [unclassified Bradyrhizobium]QIG93947.1 hypothetical protein G6P99_16590 [Bradyrhizobium sp. 6(2017)]
MPGLVPGIRVSGALPADIVIASHPVGAKRRRMTGSAKQSIAPLAETWIASSLALLAMTVEAACKTLFTIFVDRMFTTFLRRAFTKARDAPREDAAIA